MLRLPQIKFIYKLPYFWHKLQEISEVNVVNNFTAKFRNSIKINKCSEGSNEKAKMDDLP